MQNIVIFGASGHGSVVLDCILQERKYNVIGYIDSFKERSFANDGYRIIGDEFDLPYLIEKFNISGGIIAIGDNWMRKCMYDRIIKIAPDFNFVKVVHPSCILGRDVNIGKGSCIMPGAIINANSVVGNFCIINTKSSLDHDSYLANFSSLGPGVSTGGNFRLEKFSAISLGVTIIENITIKAHPVVGTGSIVLKDIENNVVAYGSPARVIRHRNIGESYLAGGKNSSEIAVENLKPIYSKGA